jgi:glycosyltransferase involved in cell wall biosynthesis
MLPNKKISVIMSVYNNEATLEKSVESILSQSYENLEFFIIDDFSSDNTKKILKNYQKKDKRIKTFFNEENLGLTKSLNILLKRVDSNSIIARQDGDDFSEKDRFTKQINFILNDNYDAVYSRAKRIHDNKLIPGKSFFLNKKFLLNFRNPYIHGTLMAKYESFKKVGFYDEDFYYAQDYKLILDFHKNGLNTYYIGEPLYNLNMENNISTNFREEQKKFFIKARKYNR